MTNKVKVLCDASAEKGRICEIYGNCSNSGAEYEVTLTASNDTDCFLLCKGCMKKLQIEAEDAGYVVNVRKLDKGELRDLGY